MERFGAAVVQEGSGLDRMELPRDPHTRGAGAAGRAEGGAARRSHYGLLRGTSHQDSVTAAPATGGAAVCAQLPAAEIYEDSHFGSVRPPSSHHQVRT